MKTLKSKLCVILSVFAILCFGLVAVMQLAPTKVSASVEGYSVTDFKMLDKGSVRKDLAQNGLRFATFIGDDSAEASYDFVNDYELGTLFLPKEAIEGKALTIEGTYKNGIKAVAAVFDGDKASLTTDDTYTGGKLFNAVIELTDFANSEQALNGKIVARTYVKNKTTNEVAYLDAVERSAAYVAALALEAEEDDTDGTLSSYVQYVEIANAPDVINVGSWGALSTWGQATKLDLATNVEDIAVSYSVEKGFISSPNAYAGTPVAVDLVKLYDADEDGAVNDIIGLNEGDTNLVASFAGKTQKIPVTVSLPQVAFFGKTYVPSGNFTIRAANVATVKYEGQTLVEGTDYTYDAATKMLVIAKSKIFPSYAPNNVNLYSWGSEANAAAVDKKVEITTTGGEVSTVEVYARQVAKIAFFEGKNGDATKNYNNSKIKELIFLDAKITDYNIGDLALNPGKMKNANRGALSIGRISSSVAIGYINLNSDYAKCYGIDVDNKASGAGLYLQWSCDGTFSVMNGTDATGKQLAWGTGPEVSRLTEYPSDFANLTFGDGIETLDVNINIITDVKEESLAGDLTVTDFLFMYCETIG